MILLSTAAFASRPYLTLTARTCDESDALGRVGQDLDADGVPAGVTELVVRPALWAGQHATVEVVAGDRVVRRYAYDADCKLVAHQEADEPLRKVYPSDLRQPWKPSAPLGCTAARAERLAEAAWSVVPRQEEGLVVVADGGGWRVHRIWTYPQSPAPPFPVVASLWVDPACQIHPGPRAEGVNPADVVYAALRPFTL